jgi:ATP-binding cassette, subfamily C (CFTR/MRP), member 1
VRGFLSGAETSTIPAAKPSLLQHTSSSIHPPTTHKKKHRFSKDTEALDVSLGGTVQSALTCAASSLFAVLVVVGTTPASVLALIPLAWAYARVQTSYIGASREIKRLDSIAASPVFGGFSEVLAGLTTVRAFGLGDRAGAAQRARLDAATRTHWPLMCLNRWLSVRLELLGIGVVACAAVSAGVLLPTSPGVAGLAITSALSLTGLLAWMVRQVTELEVSMNAVERVDEYCRVPPEAPPLNPACRPPPGWPSTGTLAVRGLVVRYRPGLDPALRGVSFDVPGGSRLGVAGRTGSGKTSLMMALFRIVEPEAGSVTLDGINTARLGLADLRGRGLGIVPQDAILFSGSIRSNVDPFDSVRAPGGGGDAALWHALDAAGLGPAVRAMGEGNASGLDARVAEGGANLSHGQRQLLCMARALLRSPRVLVLDEATSSVDPATDRAIQATIRSAFAGSTLLIIAHRLRTIADADAVLVLEAGRVAEHGPPGELLSTPGSAFRAMVEEAARQGRGDRDKAGGSGRGGGDGGVDLEVRPESAADLLAVGRE